MKHPTKELGDLFFYPITGAVADEYDKVLEEDVGIFRQQAKLLIVLARNEDRTPRFTDADFERIYNLEARVLAKAVDVGRVASGAFEDDVDEVKKK